MFALEKKKLEKVRKAVERNGNEVKERWKRGAKAWGKNKAIGERLVLKWTRALCSNGLDFTALQCIIVMDRLYRAAWTTGRHVKRATRRTGLHCSCATSEAWSRA